MFLWKIKHPTSNKDRPITKFIDNRAFRRACSVSGLTLIELLVAAAVSFIVLATALLLYTSAVGRVARRDHAGRRQEAAIALAVIERDMNCAVAVQGVGTQEVFTLIPRGRTDKEKFQLKCFTASASASEDGALLRVYDVLKVEYALDRDKGNFYRLIRSVRPFRGNNELYEPVSETLCRDVKSLVIEVFDGVSWTNEWRAFVSDPVPAAAAVTLCFAGQDEPVRTWTVIPTGLDLKTLPSHRNRK